MRGVLLESVLKHAHGMIAKHTANVEVYLARPAGIGEHSDVIGAIEIELDAIAKYNDHIGIMKKYFMNHGSSQDPIALRYPCK